MFKGTHDIQNINLSSSSAGEISVTGNFINGSTATAMLVIVYSDRLSDVYYMFSPSSSKQEKVMTIVTGLSSGLYNVSIFVVKENGLPFNRSATTPRSVSVTEGGRGKLIHYHCMYTCWCCNLELYRANNPRTCGIASVSSDLRAVSRGGSRASNGGMTKINNCALTF